MLEHFFSPDIPLLNLALRALIVYLSVLILLRLSGKRQMGQMGATEFVAVLLISNAVQNAMNGGDNSITGGIVLAAVLIAASTLISYLTFRSKFFAAVFEGTPTLLVNQGRLVKKSMHSERMSESELHVLLRKQGIHSLKNISTAILEADGTLSVTPIKEEFHQYPTRSET